LFLYNYCIFQQKFLRNAEFSTGFAKTMPAAFVTVLNPQFISSDAVLHKSHIIGQGHDFQKI